MRVVIDARLRSGQSGGVESVVIGLASGLSALDDADDRYLFLAHEDEAEWLRDHLTGPSTFLLLPSRQRLRSVRRTVARTLPPVARAWREIRRRRRIQDDGPPLSDGTIESSGAQVMHFTFQAGFRTRVPSIYHPHDLQHLHLPAFFTSEDIAWRERWYRSLCVQATMVAVASSWTKRDVERQYELSPEKVVVVPWAPPTAAYRAPSAGDVEATLRRLRISGDFILYPAQTWPHKNHIGLLRALALLRDRDGTVVSLVACGRRSEGFDDIERAQEAFGLAGQVIWPGFVSESDLQALYARARAVVIPTRFEAASAPLWEAFLAGVPVACSNVTSLPEQAGDAAMVFDPDDIEAMAAAIHSLWSDEALRRTLIARGKARVGAFTWDRTARLFRAHYRRIAGETLSAQDRELVAARVPI